MQNDHRESYQSLLKGRFSCRGYLTDPVDRSVIAGIVHDAQQVPSWCNAQPWQILVADQAETERLRNKLTTLPPGQERTSDIEWPKQYTGVYQDRRRTCGWQLYEATGVAKGDREAAAVQGARNFEFFGAPHVAIITSEADLGPYGQIDCGAFVTGFLLAAQAQGVATIAQAAIASMSNVVREHFDIPENRTFVCAISFGYADPDHPANGFRTKRAPLEEVIDWRGF